MELRMLSGLHRGATLELEEDSSVLAIGTSPNADVLMADPGIARLHCKLSRQAKRWHIQPVEGNVFDRLGRAVTAATVIEQGNTFRLGDVWIGFFAATDPWEDVVPASAPAADVQTRRYPRAKTSIIVAVLAAIALPGAWLASMASQGAAAPKTGGVERTMQPKPGNQPVSAAKLADEFVRLLAERELTKQLDLQLGADNWDIRGSLDPEEQERFERLLVHFTETRKPGFPINVTLMTPAELLPFKVIEVITGKGAGVVTDSGDRLNVGDTYQGWRLSGIESGKVVFVGRQRVEVAL